VKINTLRAYAKLNTNRVGVVFLGNLRALRMHRQRFGVAGHPRKWCQLHWPDNLVADALGLRSPIEEQDPKPLMSSVVSSLLASDPIRAH
jgi:hypothetical protein